MQSTRFLTISTSPNPNSLSRKAGSHVSDVLKQLGCRSEFFDCQQLSPLWVGSGASLPAEWSNLIELASCADAIILTLPTYGYMAGSPTKTVIEVLGQALTSKPIMLISAAGSQRSHLAAGSLAQSLIFENGCYVFPKLTVLTSADLDASADLGCDMQARLLRCTEQFRTFAQAVVTSTDG